LRAERRRHIGRTQCKRFVHTIVVAVAVRFRGGSNTIHRQEIADVALCFGAGQPQQPFSIALCSLNVHL
jgi:hypothetical protein